MMKHLSDEELNDYLDTNDRASDDPVRAHVATCTECAARLAALDNVVAQLAHVPRKAELARELWDDIGPRLTTTALGYSPASSPSVPVQRTRAREVTWQLAAAAVIFSAGLLMGTRLDTGGGNPTVGGQPVVATSDSVDAAAEVQAAGTRYAAAVARLAGTREASTFEQGREAAIAALYAASRALAEISPTDEDALAILHTVSRSHVNRIHEASSRARTIVRF
jgi:hypothetical protein